jgi:hypothetical protein
MYSSISASRAAQSSTTRGGTRFLLFGRFWPCGVGAGTRGTVRWSLDASTGVDDARGVGANTYSAGMSGDDSGSDAWQDVPEEIELPEAAAPVVPLLEQKDLPPDVARILRERVGTRAWTAKEAEVIAAYCGFVPETPWPASVTTPWPGRCARRGHSTAPRLSSLLNGQGCCRSCGHEVRGANQTLRNLAECVAIARVRGDTVTAYALRQEGAKRRLFLRVRWGACGHTSEMGANHFRSGTRGCALCRGLQIVVGVNDLATTHPDLARQLVDPALATQVTFGSGKRLEWKCDQCAYVWRTSVGSRTGYKTGCPRCTTSGIKQATPTVLYFLRGQSTRTGVPLLKIGVSNVGKSWEGRQRVHRRAGLTDDLHPPIIFNRTEEAVLIESLWRQYVKELPAESRVATSDAPHFQETVRDTPLVRTWIETVLLPVAWLAARASEPGTRRRRQLPPQTPGDAGRDER